MNPMIWVIDDDASIRFVFDKALDVNSINHRLFENAEAALEAIKKETPDVIVSDIKMPGINGLELIKAVHEVDENIPFIIMTAHSDLSAAIDAFNEGSFEYLPNLLISIRLLKLSEELLFTELTCCSWLARETAILS